MAEVIERKPFGDGVDIRRTANGFIAYPPRDWGRGEANFHSEMFVFNRAADLAAWLLQQYTEAAR